MYICILRHYVQLLIVTGCLYCLWQGASTINCDRVPLLVTGCLYCWWQVASTVCDRVPQLFVTSFVWMYSIIVEYIIIYQWGNLFHIVILCKVFLLYKECLFLYVRQKYCNYVVRDLWFYILKLWFLNQIMCEGIFNKTFYEC